MRKKTNGIYNGLDIDYFLMKKVNMEISKKNELEVNGSKKIQLEIFCFIY